MDKIFLVSDKFFLVSNIVGPIIPGSLLLTQGVANLVQDFIQWGQSEQFMWCGPGLAMTYEGENYSYELWAKIPSPVMVGVGAWALVGGKGSQTSCLLLLAFSGLCHLLNHRQVSIRGREIALRRGNSFIPGYGIIATSVACSHFLSDIVLAGKLSVLS
jgi:hypothetical protein